MWKLEDKESIPGLQKLIHASLDNGNQEIVSVDLEISNGDFFSL